METLDLILRAATMIAYAAEACKLTQTNTLQQTKAHITIDLLLNMSLEPDMESGDH